MVDHIFSGLPPRQVENANARLEIRRDESQNRNKKKEHGESGGQSAIPWEDIAYVSIQSLKVFLESLITAEGPAGPTAPPVHEASNTMNARAASAYQSVGRAVHDENVQQPIAQPSATHVEAHFSDEEIARVRLYIGELVELFRKGVTELAMEKSANFLDSIGNAIQAAKLG